MTLCYLRSRGQEAILTYEDYRDLCEFSQEELDVIAEHDNMQRIQALAKAEYLVDTDKGEQLIRRIILDYIHHARASGNVAYEQDLKLVLNPPTF